ncbi:MAG: hypothetical protein WCB93_01815 [Gallionella sp.]
MKSAMFTQQSASRSAFPIGKFAEYDSNHGEIKAILQNIAGICTAAVAGWSSGRMTVVCRIDAVSIFFSPGTDRQLVLLQ